MVIGTVTVDGTEGGNLAEVLVVTDKSASAYHGEHAVFLYFEISPFRSPFVPDRGTGVVQNHRVIDATIVVDKDVSRGRVVVDGNINMREVAGHRHPVLHNHGPSSGEYGNPVFCHYTHPCRRGWAAQCLDRCAVRRLRR